jgi:hypothetical protein
VEGDGHNLIEVLSHHLLMGAEEDHVKAAKTVGVGTIY